MDFKRKPTKQEINIIDFLINKANYNISEKWKDNIVVQSMDDGEMGSIKIFPYENVENNRKFCKTISEFQFLDKDKITVIVSLNIDDKGDLFELDIWKTDFNKLIEFPDMTDYI